MSTSRQPLRRPRIVSPWASEKPKREALRAEKREAILRAAAVCFSRKGIEATTMDDVAGLLGVTKPTVYRLFRDKTALVEACFARACQPFIDALKAAREEGGSAIAQLRRYMSADLHIMMEDDFGRMLMMPGIVDQYSDASPAYRRGMEHLRHGVQDVIQEGIRKGELKPSLDPRLLSLALFATFNRVVRWYDPRGEYSLDDISSRYFDIFLDGVRAG